MSGYDGMSGDPLEIRCRHGVPSGRRGIVMPEDEHPSEACPECNPPDVGPDDDDYIARPALGRTHPYGTRSI